jgi:hypothetical protein
MENAINFPEISETLFQNHESDFFAHGVTGGLLIPVFLSQFARSVTYIPLETTTAFMIGEKSVRVKPCGEYLFVSEHGKPVGVYNDIDGGPSFFPGWDNEKGHSFVRLFNAIDLIDYQKESSKSILVKDTVAARKFRSMAAALNENSNPVVMLVELD